MRKLLLAFLAVLMATVSVSCEDNKDDGGETVIGNNIAEQVGAGKAVTLFDLEYRSGYVWELREYTLSYMRRASSQNSSTIPDFGSNGLNVNYSDARINQDGKYVVKTSANEFSFSEQVIDFTIDTEDLSGKSLKANKYFAEQEIKEFPAGSELIKITSDEPIRKDFVVDDKEIAILETSRSCYSPVGNAISLNQIQQPIDNGTLGIGTGYYKYKIEISEWGTETPKIEIAYKDNSSRYNALSPFDTWEKKLPTTNVKVTKRANSVDPARADTYIIELGKGFTFVMFQMSGYVGYPTTQDCLATYEGYNGTNESISFNRIASEHIAEKWDASTPLVP